MAYTKNSWKSGDVVTSSKLNHMEDGIADAGGGGVLVVGLQEDNATLNKTWQEIYDAMAQGKLCVHKVDAGDPEGGIRISVHLIDAISVDNGKYKVRIAESVYSATSADGYPSIDAFY